MVPSTAELHIGFTNSSVTPSADEAHAALRVGVAAVHEAVHVGLLKAVFAGNLDELVQVVERRVHASVGGEAHQVELLAVVLGVCVRADNLGILHYRAVLAGAVDLHEVLVYYAAGAYVEVAHLRVAHLSVGQANVFARGLELRVGAHGRKRVEVWSRGVIDHVTLAVFADAPSVEDHQQCFLCHSLIPYILISIFCPQSYNFRAK